MIFNIQEIIDIGLMTLVIGYIFKDLFSKRPAADKYDPLKVNTKKENFWFAAIAVGSSIILHELGHKFVAMALGINATFHAAYSFLVLGLLLKLMNFGLIFLVPAYVSHPPTIPIFSSAIAFAGPATNLVLWLILGIAIKNNWINKRYLPLAYATKYINGFLFIVNMIPFPGIDGYWVFKGLAEAI